MGFPVTLFLYMVYKLTWRKTNTCTYMLNTFIPSIGSIFTFPIRRRYFGDTWVSELISKKVDYFVTSIIYHCHYIGNRNKNK